MLSRNAELPNYLSGEFGRRVAGQTWDSGAASRNFGLFLSYAAEMNDQETKQKLLDYAERNFNGTWENGAYYYPRNDDYQPDAQGNVRGVDPWGNLLITMARLNRGGGVRKLYTEPWGPAQYAQPYISDVNYATTNVTQAIYDPRKQALIVTLAPGPVPARNASFVVRQLDANKRYNVIKDGRVIGSISSKGPQRPGFAWRNDGTVQISTDLARERSFVIVAS